MALSDWEYAAGVREFSLRARYRVIVFDPSEGWWRHRTDAQGGIIDRHPLPFSDVEDYLGNQPSVLDEARKLERSR